MIVIDASAALELVLRTTAGAMIETRITRSEAELLAPHLIDLEVAQVLRRHARLAELDEQLCTEALAKWMRSPLTRYPHADLLPRVWELRHNLTAYDAVYVALAETLAVPLITHDRKLAGATSHRAVIELI